MKERPMAGRSRMPKRPRPRTSARSARKPARRAAKPAGKRDVRVRTRMVTPYLAIHNAGHAMDWYKSVFGAQELNRQLTPEGKVMHGALKIGDSVLLLADDFGGSDVREPRTLGGTSVNL